MVAPPARGTAEPADRDGAGGRRRRRSCRRSPQSLVAPLLAALLGGALLLGAVPRLVAAFHLLPGDPGMALLNSGQLPSPQAYQRIVASRRAAADWLPAPSTLTDLGVTSLSLAQASTGRRAMLLDQAERQLQAGLAGAPVDPHAWTYLAFIHTATGDHERAALALHLALRTGPLSAGAGVAAVGARPDQLAVARPRRRGAARRRIRARDAPRAGSLRRRRSGQRPERGGARCARPWRRPSSGPSIGSWRARRRSAFGRNRAMTTRALAVLARPRLPRGCRQPGRAAMSVGNYLLIEAGQAEVDPRYAYVYVSGVLDALTTFNEAMRGAGISLFCPIDDAQPIEIDAFKALIDQAIEQDKAVRPDFEQYARAASIGSSGSGC